MREGPAQVRLFPGQTAVKVANFVPILGRDEKSAAPGLANGARATWAGEREPASYWDAGLLLFFGERHTLMS
jgi:hypothetical protein